MFDHSVPSMPNLYVARKLRADADDVRELLAELPSTLHTGSISLEIDDDGRGSLRPGRLRPAFRVELVLDRWSDDLSELAIRPTDRGAAARADSYTRAAGVMADAIAAQVLAAAADRAIERELRAPDEVRRAS